MAIEEVQVWGKRLSSVWDMLKSRCWGHSGYIMLYLLLSIYPIQQLHLNNPLPVVSRSCVYLSDLTSSKDIASSTTRGSKSGISACAIYWHGSKCTKRLTTLDYFFYISWSNHWFFNHLIYTASSDIILIMDFKNTGYESLLQNVFRKSSWSINILHSSFFLPVPLLRYGLSCYNNETPPMMAYMWQKLIFPLLSSPEMSRPNGWSRCAQGSTFLLSHWFSSSYGSSSQTLMQSSVNVFCKGPYSKYFSLCSPHIVSIIYSS